MKIHTHLFLVGDDLIPNITPALDPKFSPCAVYLLFAPIAENHAKRLEAILRQAGINSIYPWNIMDQWDIEHVRQRVLEFVSSDSHNGDIVLNVTCGSKPMSIAAFDVFQYAEKPVYHVHPENDYIVWLHRGGKDRETFNLADEIKLPEYLAAHDMRLVSCKTTPIPPNIRSLTDHLVNNVTKYARPLEIINGLAADSIQTLISPILSHVQKNNSGLQALISLFSQRGLLTLTAENRIQFKDEESRFFVNGGWLEEHVYGVLNSLRKKISTIQDLARGVNIEWDTNCSPVANEIDVAMLSNNQLYVIECKTINLNIIRKEGSNILYKLNTVRDFMGGKNAKAMLISFRRLTTKTRLRAEEFGINICEGENLRYLHTFLYDCIKKTC